MSKIYLYRRGDGNEGNYQRSFVTLADDECPYAALAALIESDFIVGCRNRRHIRANIETSGEPEFGIDAWVHEGPKGEQAFGAAWLTAELQPYTKEEYERSPGLFAQSLRDALDLAAWRRYLRVSRAKGAQS